MAITKEIADRLAWPSPAEIFQPASGAGQAFVAAAEAKIAGVLRRHPFNARVRAGVLQASADPFSDVQSVLALVLEFDDEPSQPALAEAHRLAWNLSGAHLLITTDPSQLRVWSSYALPQQGPQEDMPSPEIAELRSTPVALSDPNSLSRYLLHWSALLADSVRSHFPDLFDPSKRVDQTLLANLVHVRQSLLDEHGLPRDLAHDLLARLIFVQFLFDRTDAEGVPALNHALLRSLAEEGVLPNECGSLDDILQSVPTTYALFRWLNQKFNGDLFPGDPESPDDPGWSEELRHIKQVHLDLLRDFVNGRIELPTGQGALWRMYAFDALPLDFISSVYEEFVDQEDGKHYTPGFFADHILDRVLPWDSEEWDVRILDPSCGSGVFLVKAFQRLIFRWRRANPGAVSVPPEVLARMLSQQLVGIDIDADAVRVAAFSLYLAMCDAIDPRNYWTDVRFPNMRGRQILALDFFAESVDGHLERGGTFDLVVGNAPWGQGTLTEAAKRWAGDNKWVAPNADIGPLFLPKAAAYCRRDGQIALLQPAMTLLGGQTGTARRFRAKLLEDFDVAEIHNFSALRRSGLFTESVSPTCGVVLKPVPSDSDSLIRYVIPGAGWSGNAELSLSTPITEWLSRSEAIDEPELFTILHWGGRRDANLIRELSHRRNLASLRDEEGLSARKGVVVGQQDAEMKLEGLHYHLSSPALLEMPGTVLAVEGLERVRSIPVSRRDGTGNTAPFTAPQILIKKSLGTYSGLRLSWKKFEGDAEATGVVCSQSVVSLSFSNNPDWFATVAASLAKRVSTYWLMLTSPRLSFERPEATLHDVLSIPVWEQSHAGGDALGEAEELLVNDMLNYRLPARHGSFNVRQRADASYRGPERADRSVIDVYIETLWKVFASAFGPSLGVTVSGRGLSGPASVARVRAVKITLGPDVASQVSEPREAVDGLVSVDAAFRDMEHIGTVYRECRFYSTESTDGHITVLIVKPDYAMAWLPSAALKDADATVQDLLVWPAGQAIIG